MLNVTIVTFVWVSRLSCCTNLSKFKPPGAWTLTLFADCFKSTKGVDSFSVEKFFYFVAKNQFVFYYSSWCVDCINSLLCS